MIFTIKNGRIVPLVDKDGKRYDHRSQAEKRKHTKQNERSHKYYSFYESTAWKHKSRQVREREPLCRACVEERNEGKRNPLNVHFSESVDHIRPIKEDWNDRLKDWNLQPLCHWHHSLKNKIDSGYIPRQNRKSGAML